MCKLHPVGKTQTGKVALHLSAGKRQGGQFRIGSGQNNDIAGRLGKINRLAAIGYLTALGA